MAIIELKPEKSDYKYLFSPYDTPMAHINPGDTVVFHTNDAATGRIQTTEDLPSIVMVGAPPNPLTGPVYIEGAKPGDALAVTIESIEATRDFAFSALLKYFGGLTSTALTATLQEPLPEKVWIWKLVDEGKYLISDQMVRLPWDPFMGTFAVAPDQEVISSMTPGPFGGNMDVPDVRPGNTIYLPVFTEGALFYTGDCHARQGQGELSGVALEIPAKATLHFDLLKNKKINWPRIESPDKIMVVGSARPMEDAARIAYEELVRWLEEEYDFHRWDAYDLLSQAGGLYVGNMVDTNYSLVASIKKDYLKRV